MKSEELFKILTSEDYKDAIIEAYNLALDHAAKKAKTSGDSFFGIEVDKDSILNLKIKD